MYLLQGKLTAQTSQAEELADILSDAAQLMKTAEGCKLYILGKDDNDPNAVYVTEIWESKEHHDQSLNVEGVRELTSKAMPLLDGLPKKEQELQIIGGIGI